MFTLGKGESTGKIIHLVENNGVVISTAHYSVEECGQGLHYHENPHICFVFQGGDVEIRNNNSYERKTGDIYFYHAGEKHASVSRREISKNINIEFSQNFLQKYSLSASQIADSVKHNPDSRFCVLKIQKEILIKDNCSDLAIESLLLNLTDSSKTQNRKTPKWVKKLDDLLNDRWNEQFTLEELAAAVEKYPTTISKHFPKYFSCTMGEYLRKIRIKKSIHFIKNTDLSLTDIAFHCGFADQSHFTRNFKEFTGFLPKDFRRI